MFWSFWWCASSNSVYSRLYERSWLFYYSFVWIGNISECFFTCNYKLYHSCYKKKTEENLHEKYWDIAENVLQSFFQYFVKSVIRWLLLKITLPQLSYFPQNKKICTLQKTYFSIKTTFSQLEFSICCFSVFRFVIIC